MVPRPVRRLAWRIATHHPNRFYGASKCERVTGPLVACGDTPPACADEAASARRRPGNGERNSVRGFWSWLVTDRAHSREGGGLVHPGDQILNVHVRRQRGDLGER